MNKSKLLIVLLSLLAFTALVLTGCSGWQNEENDPILLIQVTDWNNSGDTIKNLRIVDDDNSTITIYEGVLEMQEADDGNLSGGYSYFLAPGGTYTKLIWEKGGNDIERSININNAETGMVYYASIS